MDAMLSHEIAKVVDTLRANQYKDNFSLAEMAAISRMPMETFRKRFVSEVGMPPLSYVLHCKMERAKGCCARKGTRFVRQASKSGCRIRTTSPSSSRTSSASARRRS